MIRPLACLPLLLLCAPALAQDTDRSLGREAEEATPTSGDRWALLIGIDDYEDDQIRDLQFSAADAHAMFEMLVTQGGFSPDHVVLMTDDAEPASRPTRTNILQQLERLRRVAQGQMVLFYYSGHGLGAQGGTARQNYLIPSDARLGLAEDTALSLDRVLGALDAVPVQQRLLIFDACRNQLRTDTKGELAAPWTDTRYALSQGTRLLFCSAFGEVSYEDPTSGHGACTGQILTALSGQADGELGDGADGVVSTRELESWLAQRLPATTQENPQTPYFGGEWSGDFALTRATAAPAPPGIPKPGQPLTDRDLRAGLQVALHTYDAGERRGFLSASGDLRDALTGLTEPASTDAAIDFHRVQFLYQDAVRERSQALEELLAIYTLDPRHPPLGGFASPPPGYEGVDPSTLKDPPGPRVALPGHVRLRVDGDRARALPAERPALVQAINCDDTVQWTRYVEPGSKLPPITSGVRCGPPARTWLAAGAGASLLASGGMLAAGLVERHAFYATLEACDGSLSPQSDLRAEATRHQQRANALGYGAQASAGLALGLGTAWLLMKF